MCLQMILTLLCVRTSIVIVLKMVTTMLPILLVTFTIETRMRVISLLESQLLTYTCFAHCNNCYSSCLVCRYYYLIQSDSISYVSY